MSSKTSTAIPDENQLQPQLGKHSINAQHDKLSTGASQLANLAGSTRLQAPLPPRQAKEGYFKFKGMSTMHGVLE